MLLYKTPQGPAIHDDGRWLALPHHDWDALIQRDHLNEALREAVDSGEAREDATLADAPPLAPIGTQEVWAAGVTYFRSRTARMEESESAGGGSFYDRVYHADRPELFLKATPHRVVGTGSPLHLRRDSSWIVPEAELTLLISPAGRITGYTLGNDLSCRDIEGENPLYLPQAKTFDRCAAVGPGILITNEPLPHDTELRISVHRDRREVFAGDTTLDQMKRTPAELAEYLCRETTFPTGCLLMTGTGIIPPDEFTLRAGDEVRITADPIGSLINTVE